MPLILSRRNAESVLIGDEITVTAVSCVKGRVKLIVSAPADLVVRRAELLDCQKAAGVDDWSGAQMRRMMLLAREWKHNASRNNDLLANSCLDELLAVAAEVRA